ncbi:MAG: 1-deoxy-D-xylulose-5-phosphate reductoisomerase [Fibrobacter sp.]|nr:1-deoxy-D-xylulose-5-phosphate reductoisomerase [Fibrobacter sp.]
MKSVCLLGATGSIGDSALEIIRQHPDEFILHSVAAYSQWEKLAQIIKEFNVRRVCLFDETAAQALREYLGIPVLCGMSGLEELASDSEADIVINALMGAVGGLPTLRAIHAGKHIALANKETMVMAGPIIQDALLENPNAKITPIDSEHNAIFQCLAGRPASEVECLQITASGGPFRTWAFEKFSEITLEDALNHPVWSMGKKITIDSASMMNKGLEVIEAHFLFGIPYEQIQVVVHPQSRVHSLVQFKDGNLMAQLGAPDMKIPIQAALTWPLRLPLRTERLHLAELKQLTFEAPDFQKFPCLAIAYEAGKLGGVYPAMMNAANEVLVDAFLKRKIRFTDIPKYIETVMGKTPKIEKRLTLPQALEADAEARRLARELVY